MRLLYDVIGTLRRCSVPVSLLGETGRGKGGTAEHRAFFKVADGGSSMLEESPSCLYAPRANCCACSRAASSPA
jgi:hypothetical protein